MARFFFAALLVVCFVYVLQASPVPEGNEEKPNFVDELLTYVNQTATDVAANVGKFMEDPNVQKVAQGFQGLAENAKKTFEQSVAALTPKTEDSQTGKQ